MVFLQWEFSSWIMGTEKKNAFFLGDFFKRVSMGKYLTILCCHCNMESVLINSDNHLEKKQAIDDDCGTARPHPQIQYLIERPGDFSGEENLFEKEERVWEPFWGFHRWGKPHPNHNNYSIISYNAPTIICYNNYKSYGGFRFVIGVPP